MLLDIALFLAVAVLFVPLFRRLGLGAVLGYLAAGAVIGPSGLGLVGQVEEVLHFSEFGVVLLMFLIGLELQPSRLWTLRRMVFGLGGAQVLLSGMLLAVAALWIGAPSLQVAVAIGFGLAMSSTALVLQLLAERKELSTRHGRAAFSILLFQDIAVIPMLAVIPLLAPEADDGSHGQGWMETLKTLGVFAIVIWGGRYAVRPALRMVAAAETPELLTAAALLIVIATALAMDAVGLSMSLGAFLAGVLLSESEYRHQLQADIEPFKGMLLGLFFIAVGMSADVGQLASQPLNVLGLVVLLLAIKAIVLFGLGRYIGLPASSARALASALPQGGEFAFVLFSAATVAGLIDSQLTAQLVLVVTLSMIATPALYALQTRWRDRPDPSRPYDQIDAADNSVIIAGFGPFGQIVARILGIKQVPFTVLDKDSEQVDFVRRFGNKIFYGDAGRLELLRAAHADQARLFVLTIPDIEASLRVASVVREHFPKLPIYAVALNRQHAMLLMDMGAKLIIRRSFYSSLEMSREILTTLGETADEAARVVEMFSKHDEATLRRQHAVKHDEQLVIQTAQEAARELEQLFEQDRPR
ncbi:glutathione-regulated potassium-efflux system protein KefB [Sinimarinibacterium sp. CAU 1509]|uniref:monovalent cation:proton antiporter-2 (CPA2) family protein n=1 Tax=Sinimarinibacterium sp. CAU 1509 TaxID=2562283 RepID=UPI0010ABA43C|nr:monovalent cation:proton antiporter-2 (CPA2) family protein [Sinimarinibacterium sp. CAU 1509]TJY63143.1 glutathione-regulated potassium-efflux system protein KefB [Sinimarinibacterium sp. CAU 1509]